MERTDGTFHYEKGRFFIFAAHDAQAMHRFPRQCGHEMNFQSYQGERAFYAGSVLFWYSTGIKGEVRRRDACKGARDHTV